MTAASDNKNPGSDSVPKAIKNSEQLRRGGGTLPAFQLWRKKENSQITGKEKGSRNLSRKNGGKVR